MTAFLTVLHVTACLVLIVVVLLQRGKGAEIGAVFGGGASTTVFGGRGAGNFLTKITTGAVVVFFLTSLSLAYVANRQATLFDDESAVEEPAPPAGEAPAGGLQEVAPPVPAEEAPQAGGAATGTGASADEGASLGAPPPGETGGGTAGESAPAPPKP